MKKFRLLAVFILTIYIFALFPTAIATDSEYITIDAKAALLVDADSGYVLVSQDANVLLYPASLTKIMTALLAIENGNLDDVVTVTDTALANLSIYGSTAGLMAGEKLTLEDLLYCTMVSSANEACNVIAEYVSGNISDFVELMNERAAELGCKNTHFANTHGLHDDEHYTTAYDIYLITKEALKHPEFVEISNTAYKELPATNLSGARYLVTTNYLISDQSIAGYVYSNARGIKTGHTTPAGMCLVSYAQKGDISLISVIMGAESVTNDDGTVTLKSFSETKRMFEWGFKNFTNETLVSTMEPITEVKVGLSSEVDSVAVHASEDVEAVMPKGFDTSLLEREVVIYSDQTGQEVLAPVEKGQVLGEMSITYNGEEMGSVELVAVSGIERSPLQYFFMQLKAFFAMPVIKAFVAVIIFIILVYIAIITIAYFRRKKKKSALGSTYKGSSRKKPM